VTPEQATRLALDIGREVTELIQRRLAEAASWGPTPPPVPVQWPSTPVREDEQPVGTFMPQWADDPDGDGGVKRQVIRTLTEDDGA
jgi:hypothetical protein